MFAELLRQKLAGICDLSPEQMNQLQRHYELLLRWNQKLNLTSVRDEAEIVERHYCESVFLGTQLPTGPLSVVDIGSGAGFPGFPVAVLRQDAAVALVESHQRKAVFLREAARDISNVRVIAERAEELQEHFDWAISRAVRYDDIRHLLRALAPNVMLLSGEIDGAKGSACNWTTRIQLPWGKRRFLLVSRETVG